MEGYILEGNQSADVFEWLCIRGILDFRLCLHHGKEPFESGEAFLNHFRKLHQNLNRAEMCIRDRIVHTTEELLEELKKYDEEEIFVIGGESVYRMMLPYCSKVYVTKIDHAYQADTYFPNLDQLEDWEMTEVSEEHTCFDLEYVFSTYERRQ